MTNTAQTASLPSATKAHGYRPDLCEAHAARYAPGTYNPVPHWTELPDDVPVPCETCAVAIMRKAGVL